MANKWPHNTRTAIVFALALGQLDSACILWVESRRTIDPWLCTRIDRRQTNWTNSKRNKWIYTRWWTLSAMRTLAFARRIRWDTPKRVCQSRWGLVWPNKRKSRELFSVDKINELRNGSDRIWNKFYFKKTSIFSWLWRSFSPKLFHHGHKGQKVHQQPKRNEKRIHVLDYREFDLINFKVVALKSIARLQNDVLIRRQVSFVEVVGVLQQRLRKVVYVKVVWLRRGIEELTKLLEFFGWLYSHDHGCFLLLFPIFVRKLYFLVLSKRKNK